MTDTERMLLINVATALLPTVREDLERTEGKPPDLLDAITEAASYAADLVAAVDSLDEDGGGDDGESQPVEVIQPRTRRHA